MKSIIYFFILGCLLKVNDLSAQDTINYFNQEPPGDSAIVFSPDFISTDDRFVQSSSFTPDGKEFSFTITDGDWYIIDVMYTKYVDDHWTDPVVPDFLQTTLYRGWGLRFSPDSNRYYLLGVETSDAASSMFYGERSNDTTWGEPVRIPDPISSSRIGEPSVSYRNTLFFSKNGIQFSELEGNEYLETTRMNNPISISGSSEIDPYISPDEDYLIFSSNRKTGDDDEYDIYISYKKPDGKWTNPKDLGPKINGAGWDFAPYVTPDGKYLLFTRREKWTTSKPAKLFWVSSSFIDSLKLTNYVPYVLNVIPNQTGTIGNLFSYTIPDTIFFDDDEDDILTYSASLDNGDDLPGWLDFDSVTVSLSGIPSVTENLYIKITATDTAGESVSDIFILAIEAGTGINNNAIDDNIAIYPVPASQTIIINSDITEINYYVISDLNGKVVKQEKPDSKIIDVSGLNHGVYILKLQTDKGSINRKIVIE